MIRFRNLAIITLAILFSMLLSFRAISASHAQIIVRTRKTGFFSPGSLSGKGGHILHQIFPRKLRQACLLLEHGDSAQAAALFAHALQEYPDDRYAFIGLAQSDPSQWPAEIREMRTKLARNPYNLNAEFDLAVLLDYDQLKHPLPVENIYPYPLKYTEQLMEPLHLIQAVWTKQKTFIVGATCAAVMFTHVGTPTLEDMLETIIPILTMPPAYQMYLNVKHNDWEGAPPPARLTPLKNRRRLLWVLHSIYDEHGIQWSGPIIAHGYHHVVMLPVKPQDKRAMAYISRWLKELQVKK